MRRDEHACEEWGGCDGQTEDRETPQHCQTPLHCETAPLRGCGAAGGRTCLLEAALVLGGTCNAEGRRHARRLTSIRRTVRSTLCMSMSANCEANCGREVARERRGGGAVPVE